MATRLKQRIDGLTARAAAEGGQGLAEYGLILGLIAAVCIGALTLLGSTISGSSGFVDLPGAL
jgi:Flp pilus assembly pilin Flp